MFVACGVAARHVDSAGTGLCLTFRGPADGRSDFGSERERRRPGVCRKSLRRFGWARPAEIISASTLRRNRFAARERAHCKRIGAARPLAACGPQKLIAAAGRNRQRNDGAGERAGCDATNRLAPGRSLRLQWQRDGGRPISKGAQDFPLYVTGELAGSEPGEIDAVP